jgi:signal transduction histidine kinase/CheY-like chemotaxis protein
MAAESLLQVVELFPGPALIVGPGGAVVGVNDRSARWFGLARDKVRGRPLAQFVAESPEHVAGFLEDCAQRGRKAVGTFTALQGDGAGEQCRVEGISVQLRPETNEPPLVVVRVIPGRLGDDRIAADHEVTIEALQEERRLNDEFLGRLAHDLRNPVAAISSALHLVRRASTPEDVAWAEEAMERQIKHLVRQIDDLLDLSRIARGKIELSRQRLDATAVARSAAAAVRPMIGEHIHELTLSISPGELAVDADPARIEQILVGVLRHVARTTNPGVSIRLSVAREQDTVVFQVQDHGESIPTAKLPQGVGQPAPGESSEDQHTIGLMLVEKLVELHGGSASFRDKGSGVGLEVAIRLPAAADLSQSKAAPVAETSPAAPTGARVLIVDDNVDTTKSTARLLQLAGYDVRVAHDGRQALEVAHDFHPRFVLLDIGLPIMDGYEVARQLRGDPELRDTVIIAVSGYSAEDYHPSEEARFDHHLVKPIDYDALRAILNPPA